MSDKALCHAIEEELAQVLDGTAPASTYEHIAECDACRDLRHEAARAADLVAHAGADFVAPPDFPVRLLEGIHTQGVDGGIEAVASPPAPAPSQLAPSPLASTVHDDAHALASATSLASDIATAPTTLAAGPVGASNGGVSLSRSPEQRSQRPIEPSPAPAAAAAPARPAVTPPPDTRGVGERASAPLPRREGASTRRPRLAQVVELFRKRSFLVALAATMSTAAGVGFLLRGRVLGSHAAEPWSATITQVSRAASDANGGLEACDAKGACSPVSSNAPIAAGTTVRTDARTRAYLTLSDGSELAIDRGSSIELVAKAPRTARVLDGTVAIDVAHLERAPSAHVAFGECDAEVLGTKLAVTEMKARASVEVARGVVRVRDKEGRIVDVRAGEEATLVRGSEPVVASATSLADFLEWSDKSPEEVDAPTLRGVGELRARKPGAAKDKEHAVRLAKHAVKVRVVDVVARTEVDETFANDTDDELEGTFRFPLPPGAQIEKLALEVDGKLVDGAFVDRDKGAAIWRGVIQNAAPKAPKPREEIIWVPGPWRDPALLEWQRGGRFELRIFPIPKHGSKRVVLSYTQLVEQAGGVRRFTYALAHDPSGTTRIDQFDLDLQLLGSDPSFGVQTRGYDLVSTTSGDGGAERRTMHADGFVPAGDLTVEYALPDRNRELTGWGYVMDPPASAAIAQTITPSTDANKKAAAAATQGGEQDKAALEAANAIIQDPSAYVAIALRPKLPRWEKSVERVHAIVVDSSRSMFGERFARASRLAAALVREMDRRDSFVLLACDTQCRPMTAADGSARPTPPSAAASGDVERFLATVEPDGGSDLAAAVSAATTAVGSLGDKELRIEYLGDGTPTVGPIRASHLELAVHRVMPSNGAIVAVALGTDADTTSLTSLARGGGGVMMPYVPGQRVASAALDVLGAAYGRVLRDAQVELPAGLAQVTPAQIDPIRAGGETFVFARMTGGEVSGNVTLKGRVEGEAFEQRYPVKITASRSAGNAFIPRMFAGAKIAELDRTGGDASKRTVVELSQHFAVASRFTSLLVLESQAMFDAFGLKRQADVPAFTGETAAQSESADSDEAVADAIEGAPAGRTGGGVGHHAAPKRASGGGPSLLDPLAGDDAPMAGEKKEADKKKDSGLAKGDRDGLRGSQAPVTASIPSPSATMAPPAAPPPRPTKPAEEPPADAHPRSKVAGPSLGNGGRSADLSDPWNNDFRSRRVLVPMKRVFDRHASFETTNLLAQQNAAKLISAEAAIAGAPDSRDKTLELFTQYAMAGRLGEAEELTARWSGRDALDPDALLARADLAARRGDRDRAVRVLGGLVDVRPGDRAAQVRLAELHEAAGEAALACEHRIAAAELGAADPNALALAVRCTRAQGMGDLGAQLEADAPPKIRDAVERLVAAAQPPAPSGVRGDVQITADWSSPVDLDIALIDGQGKRISWLGSPSKLGVTARDVTSPRSEQLGLTSLPAGSYVVEIARASGGDAPADPVRGEVQMRLAGETRKIPFVLTGSRVELGTIRVFFTSRLVPVDSFPVR